jgi:hypothetical protein
MPDADRRPAPPLWPFLVLCAGLAAWIDLGSLHRSHYADSLLPVQISLQRWTPFFWEQDRIGMLLPLLARPVKHPLFNLLLQDGLAVFAGLASLFLLARYAVRDASYPLAGALAVAAFLGLTPAYYRFEFLVNTLDGVWLALGLGALLLVEPRPDGRVSWRRAVLALLLMAVAHWVYTTAALFLGPLVVLRWIFFRPEGPSSDGWLRRELRGETAAGLAVMAGGCGTGFVVRALFTEGGTQFDSLPAREWPITFARMLENTWVNLTPQLWPLALGLLALGGVGLLAARKKRGQSPFSPDALKGAAVLALAALGLGLFMATRKWVQLNLHMFRYLLPSAVYVQAAVCAVAAAPLCAAVGLRGRRVLYALAVVAMAAAAAHSYGRPSLKKVRRDLAQQHISTCTSIDPLDGMTPEDVLGAGCTHVAGNYFKVWPAVFQANLVLRERGERRAVWGVTFRCQPTVRKWRQVPPEQVRVAVPAGGDPEADFYLQAYGFGPLEVVERRASLWVLAPRRAADAAPAPPPDDAEAAYRAHLERWAQRRREAVARLPLPPAPPDVTAPGHNDIDRFIAAAWGGRPVPPLCDDRAFVRRAYLDVVGHVPDPAEAEAFVADTSPDKRTRLIARLLDRADDYAHHWVPFWEEALCSDGLQEGGVLTVPDQRDWVRESFRANKPYDVFVAELLDPAEPRHRAGFVYTANHKQSTQTAANVGQLFLGTGLKCATCHNHFTNTEWRQKRFLAFAGLFSPTDLEVIRCETRKGEFVEPRYVFDLGDGRPVPPDLNGRLKFASDLTVDPANPRFARAIVNRLWKRYLGLGLVEPVDDFRADRRGSHPELLDWLAYDFLAHGCDLKHTTRLILTSRTYQLAFDPALCDRFDVQQPDRPRLFLSPSLRRLTCEQVLDSVQQALHGKVERTCRRKDSTALTRALGRPAMRNEVSTGRSEDVAVVQALELTNGGELHEMIYDSPLVRRCAAAPDRGRALDEAYRALLSRPPTEAEARRALDFLGETPSEEAWGDVVWALVMGPEFQYAR